MLEKGIFDVHTERAMAVTKICSSQNKEGVQLSFKKLITLFLLLPIGFILALLIFCCELKHPAKNTSNGIVNSVKIQYHLNGLMSELGNDKGYARRLREIEALFKTETNEIL